MSASTFLFSVKLSGSSLWLGVFGHHGYQPFTALGAARGKVGLRPMSVPTGRIHPSKVWPRRMLRAESALEISGSVKDVSFDGFIRDGVSSWINIQAENWFGRARG